MSFSLGFDELPNSYEATGDSYSWSAGGGWGDSLGSFVTLKISIFTLRVMACIRFPVIAQLILSGIFSWHESLCQKNGCSFYLPKLLGLEPEQREKAVSLIETLMKDRTSHVLDSVIASFTQVCSDRLDLRHPHYRKLNPDQQQERCRHKLRNQTVMSSPAVQVTPALKSFRETFRVLRNDAFDRSYSERVEVCTKNKFWWSRGWLWCVVFQRYRRPKEYSWRWRISGPKKRLISSWQPIGKTPAIDSMKKGSEVIAEVKTNIGPR